MGDVRAGRVRPASAAEQRDAQPAVLPGPRPQRRRREAGHGGLAHRRVPPRTLPAGCDATADARVAHAHRSGGARGVRAVREPVAPEPVRAAADPHRRPRCDGGDRRRHRRRRPHQRLRSFHRRHAFAPRCGERVLLGNHRRGRDRPDDQRTDRAGGEMGVPGRAAPRHPSRAGRACCRKDGRHRKTHRRHDQPRPAPGRCGRPSAGNPRTSYEQLYREHAAAWPRGGRPATSSSRATTARNWPCGPRSITCSAATSPATTASPSTPRATPARPTGGVSSGTPRCTCCRSSSTPTRRARARCWTSACRA